MSFVYVLVMMLTGGNSGLVVLELKEYDTWQSCQAAASASYKEYVRVKRSIVYAYAGPRGPYKCVPKPA